MICLFIPFTFVFFAAYVAGGTAGTGAIVQRGSGQSHGNKNHFAVRFANTGPDVYFCNYYGTNPRRLQFGAREFVKAGF